MMQLLLIFGTAAEGRELNNGSPRTVLLMGCRLTLVGNGTAIETQYRK